jgi:N-acetylmuramic acid 6-phosphate etherase
MTSGDTEARLGESQWLDRLDDASALRVMLESQTEAMTAIEPALLHIQSAVTAMAARLADGDGRIIYAGAGSAIRIGVQDGVELRPTFNWPRARVDYLVAGGPGALMDAVENAEDDSAAAAAAVSTMNIGPADTVLAISASGKTAFTCAAAASAGIAGALTIGIFNNADAPLADHIEIGIPLITGAEAVAGSTRLKAGTAQKVCLNMISTLVMTRLGFVRDGQMIAMQPSNAKLRTRFETIHVGDCGRDS